MKQINTNDIGPADFRSAMPPPVPDGWVSLHPAEACTEVGADDTRPGADTALEMLGLMLVIVIVLVIGAASFITWATL